MSVKKFDSEWYVKVKLSLTSIPIDYKLQIALLQVPSYNDIDRDRRKLPTCDITGGELRSNADTRQRSFRLV